MHFSTAAISTFAILGLTSAIPTTHPSATQLTPRACTTIEPAYISYFQIDTPTQSTSGSEYRLAKNETTQTIKSVFRFDNIPAGATGCSLHFRRGAGRFAIGANDASLYTVQGQVDGRTNWSNQPTKNTKVSSLQFPTTEVRDKYATIAYSSTCPESGSVSFLLEMSDWQQNAGSISFSQGPDNGFSMVYNC